MRALRFFKRLKETQLYNKIKHERGGILPASTGLVFWYVEDNFSISSKEDAFYQYKKREPNSYKAVFLNIGNFKMHGPPTLLVGEF